MVELIGHASKVGTPGDWAGNAGLGPLLVPYVRSEPADPATIEDDRQTIVTLKADVNALRTGLLGAQSAAGLDLLEPVKNRIETTLKRVVCRTERVEATLRADSMIKEKLLVPRLCRRDLMDFCALEAKARELEERETIEYWKSSPYLLNFMGQYRFKDAGRKASGTVLNAGSRSGSRSRRAR